MIGYAEFQSINNFCWGIIKTSLTEACLTEEQWERTIEAVQAEERKYRYGLCGKGISKMMSCPIYIFEKREKRRREGYTDYASLEMEKRELFSLYQYGWKLLKNYGSVETPLTDEQIASMKTMSDEIPALNPVYRDVVKDFVEACLEIIKDRQNALLQEKRAF